MWILHGAWVGVCAVGAIFRLRAPSIHNWWGVWLFEVESRWLFHDSTKESTAPLILGRNTLGRQNMSTSFKQFSIPSLAKMINEHNHVHVLYAGQAAAKNQRLPAPALVITPIPLSICTVSIKILIICIIFRTFTPHSSTNIECHNMEHVHYVVHRPIQHVQLWCWGWGSQWVINVGLNMMVIYVCVQLVKCSD